MPLRALVRPLRGRTKVIAVVTAVPVTIIYVILYGLTTGRQPDVGQGSLGRRIAPSNASDTIRYVYYATDWYGRSWPSLWTERRAAFEDCPYATSCGVASRIEEADVVLFHGFPGTLPEAAELKKLYRRADQHWVYYTREAPTVHTHLDSYNGLFNWTATQRLDSDLVAMYGYYVPLSDGERALAGKQLDLLLTKKSRMALIINSHCGPLQSQRWEWVSALQEDINVDILGKCGTGKRFEPTRKLLVRRIRRYKFYLSFENARCRDYITEKFWFNALQAGAVPVVLGGLNKRDYLKVAPPNSFIYAQDFSSGHALARYLRKVATNGTLYESYLSWRRDYRIYHHHQSHTNLPCLLCRKLHETALARTNVYESIDDFFSPHSHCNYSAAPRDVASFNDVVKNWRS